MAESKIKNTEISSRLICERVEIKDNLSINASDYANTGWIDIQKDGYSAIMVGAFMIENATSSGTLSSTVSVFNYGLNDARTSARAMIRNPNASSKAVVKVTLDILYVKDA